MQGYIIKEVGKYGFDNDLGYFLNYKKSIQSFNNFVKNELKNLSGNLINREDFSEKVSEFKDWTLKDDNTELICRTYPLFIFKKDKDVICRLFFWEKTSYEYNEWDIESTDIILKSIEIVC